MTHLAARRLPSALVVLFVCTAAAHAARVPDRTKLDAALLALVQGGSTTPVRAMFVFKHQVNLPQALQNLEPTKDARLAPGVGMLIMHANQAEGGCFEQCPKPNNPCQCGGNPGDWTVPCTDGTTQTLEAELTTRGATKIACHWLGEIECTATATPAAIDAISGRPDLAAIQKVSPIVGRSGAGTSGLAASALAAAAPTGPAANVTAIKADQAWALGVTGVGTMIGIIDSGAYPDHDLLKDASGSSRALTRPDGTINFWDFSGGAPCPTNPGNGLPKPCDDIGRGTHLLSVALGRNGQGVAPAAKWVACKAFRSAQAENPTAAPDAYLTDVSQIKDCAEWLMNPDWVPGTPKPPVDLSRVPDVILGTTWENAEGACDVDHPLRGSIQQMRELGIVPVFPAGDVDPGHDATKSVMPASFPETFSVGTVDDAGILLATHYHGAATCRRATDLSAARGAPRALAPGRNVTGAWVGGTTATQVRSGTDVAAAHVAGAMALLLSRFKQLQSDGTYMRSLPPETVEYALESAPAGHVRASRCTNGVKTCSPSSEIDDCAGIDPLTRCVGGGSPFTGGAVGSLADVSRALSYEEARTVRWEAPANAGPDNASPRICVAGISPCTDQPLTCTVTMKNMGVTTWQPGVHGLVAQQQAASFSSASSVALDVAKKPCEEKQFTIPDCKAPHAPGTYGYQWTLANAGTPVLGATPARSISVAGKNIADFVSQSPGTWPALDTAGTINVTFKNAGTTTWTAGSGYYLTGTSNAALPKDVIPGDTVTFGIGAFLPSGECTPWATRNFQYRMEDSAVPGSFTSAISPNPQPPDFDRAWLETYTLPSWYKAYNGAGEWITTSARFRNCGSRTWSNQHCYWTGEDKWGGGAINTCLPYNVYPNQTWSPSSSFQTTSGNAWVRARLTVGTWPFIATLGEASTYIQVAYNWTQQEYDVNRGWVNYGSTGFRAESSWDSGATYSPMPWNGSQWADARGFIAPVPGGGLVDLKPTGAAWYAVTLLAPFTGCYKINAATIADGDYQSLSVDPNDDGVAVYLYDAYWGVGWNVRNETVYFTDPSGWYDPENGAGGCFRVNAVGGMAARIEVRPRADKGHDLTRVSFQIRAIQD